MSEAAPPDDRRPWLEQLARAVAPYLGCAPKPDGLWLRLERDDGAAISIRQSDWPAIELLARATPIR